MPPVFLLLALLAPTLAAPNGFYHQEYNYQTQSSSYKNHELQHHNQDEGFYSKDGDLEGRFRPRVNAHSQHSEYVNPKLQHGYRIGTDRTSSFGQLHAQNRYRMGEEMGGFGMMQDYGVNSNLRQVTASLQEEMERELQRSVYDHYQRAIAYGGSITQAQIESDRRALEEELRRNVTMRLQEALKSQYGNQGIRGAYSYSIINGRLQPTANYNNQELEDLTRQMETNLMRRLQEQVQTYYHTTVNTEVHTQKNTYQRRVGDNYPGEVHQQPIYTYPPQPIIQPHPIPVQTHPQPIPDSITTVATRVQTELNEILNKILEDTQRRYFSEYNSYQNIDYNHVLAQLQEELRANITFHFDDQIKRAYGYSNYASKYSVEDIENLRRQIETNLITKLNRDFNRQREKFLQSHQMYPAPRPIPANQIYYPNVHHQQVDMANLQRQMQEQLSRGLQQALIRHSYAQSHTYQGVNPQENYQATLAQMSAELNRNLTRQMEQLNAQQMQSEMYESQLARMRNQLQQDLMRQLQQGLQQSYSHYSSWSSSSSTSRNNNYRPVRGFNQNMYQNMGEDCMMGDDPSVYQQTQADNDDLTQQTEDLTQQAEDLTQQSEDLTQQSEDLTQQTEDAPQDLTHQQSQDLTQQSEDLTQQTEELTQQSQDMTQQSEDLTPQTEDVSQDLTQQSEDLTQQSEDLTQQVQSQDNLSKPRVVSPSARVPVAPTPYVPYSAAQRAQQSQDLTQQTEDLTQHSQPIAVEEIYKPKRYSQLGQQSSPSARYINIRRDPLYAPNSDLSQQSQVFEPQDLTHQQSQDLTQQSEDLTQQVQNQDNLSKPRVVSPFARVPVAPSPYVPYSAAQQGEDLTQQTQDLTQQSQPIALEDIYKPKSYSQLGHQSSPAVRYINIRREPLYAPNSDLSQQSQVFEPQQSVYYRRFQYPKYGSNPQQSYTSTYSWRPQTVAERVSYYENLQNGQRQSYSQRQNKPSQNQVGLTQQTQNVEFPPLTLNRPSQPIDQYRGYRQPAQPIQQTQDLTQQSQDLNEQSQDLTQQVQVPNQSVAESMIGSPVQVSQDLTQQSQDLTQQSHDLTQQSEDLTQQSQDLTQAEDLTQQTEDLTQHVPSEAVSNPVVYRRPPAVTYQTIRQEARPQSQDLTQQSQDLTQAQDLTQQSQDLTQQSEDLTNSQDLTQQSEDLTQQVQDLTQPQQIEDLTQQSQDLTQQPEDLTQQSQDLTQQTEDIDQPIEPQIANNQIFKDQPSQNLAQQTQNLIQHEIGQNQQFAVEQPTNSLLAQQSQNEGITESIQQIDQQNIDDLKRAEEQSRNLINLLRRKQQRDAQSVNVGPVDQPIPSDVDQYPAQYPDDQQRPIQPMQYQPRPVYSTFNGNQFQVGTTRQVLPPDDQQRPIPPMVHQQRPIPPMVYPQKPVYSSVNIQQARAGTTRHQLPNGRSGLNYATINEEQPNIQEIKDIEPIKPQVANEVQQVGNPEVPVENLEAEVTTPKPGFWRRLGSSIKNKIG